MKRTSYPIHLIQAANPVPESGLVPDSSETLMEEIVGMTGEDYVRGCNRAAGRPASPRRSAPSGPYDHQRRPRRTAHGFLLPSSSTKPSTPGA